jgi:hypothetical protein
MTLQLMKGQIAMQVEVSASRRSEAAIAADHCASRSRRDS